jgi:hypothetical protein
MSGGTNVRVVVVDDHQPFRAVVRDVVAAIPDFTAVGEAATRDATPRRLHELWTTHGRPGTRALRGGRTDRRRR